MLDEKFMERVHEVGNCWIWQGALDAHGYGRVRRDGRSWLAHRWVVAQYEALDPAKVVMHSCDTPSCVNPVHLRQATQRENLADSHSKGRSSLKLSAGDIRRIHSLRHTRSLRALAREYNVSHTAIHRAIHRRYPALVGE